MNNNVVDILRDRTDEADLDQILRSQMGGYTKKSVTDYVARIKRQQQQSAEAFNRDMQAMLEEKESLLAENANLKNRLTKVITDYKNLSDNLASIKSGESSVSMDEVLQLRGHVRVLENDKREALAKVTQAEKTVEQKLHIIGDKNRQITQLKQETAMFQQMLSAERTDKEQLQSTVTQQATAIEQLQGEVNFLKSIVNDGNIAQLNNRIDELNSDLEKANAELSVRIKEHQISVKQISTLTQQEATNRSVNEELRTSLENALSQNEKMEAENTLLHQEVERCMKENLDMIRAQSELRVQVAILTRKLDAEKLRNLVMSNDEKAKE